ncbi:MAG TPA: hypothetical protein VN666_03420 [Nitrospira sp.]|nr:hypothetical protein [Nitrospira sp.]
MHARYFIAILSGLLTLFGHPMLVGLSSVAYAEGVKSLETVRGHACYEFGDDQTPA